MTKLDSWCNNNIAFEKGKWRLINNVHVYRQNWKSVLQHQCGPKKFETWVCVPVVNKRCVCGARPSKEILGLWYIHNMEEVGKWEE